jgi:hypothetical protein
MLCNWHFDIFWADHWRQARDLWKAGWVVRAPKEWAFVIILITFFPMLITGWWTLSMVAWEKIIYDILVSPIKLYQRFVKAPINVITTNNKYGVVKRKSYKQIRPAGVSGYRAPISDYGDNSARAANGPALGLATTPLSNPASSISSAQTRVTNKIKKPTEQAPLEHSLFRFDDDDDDDFDLDIDSFEKVGKPTAPKKTSSPKIVVDDEDDDRPKPRNNRNDNRNDKKKSAKPAVFNDDNEDDEEDENTSRNSRKDNRQNNKRDNDRDNRERDNRNKNRRDKNNSDNRTDNSEKTNRRNNGDDDNSQNNQQSVVYDALKQKGYDVIKGITVQGTIIDFVGVCESDICLCMVDRESGDWLADEELFNGEEPLWFSENSHRISPVRKLSIARDILVDKLEDEGFEQKINSYVVIQMANIINADDMFEVWNGINIDVTRINRGAPKEIPLFSKSLHEVEETMAKQDFDKLRKLLKNIK